MQREGSPWQGLWTVMAKETADHLTGIRMLILEVLVGIASVGAVYAAVTTLRETVGEDPFLFLRLFTTSRDPLPGFVVFLGFLTPLVAIALGFDTINGEFNRRTLSRVLAQPIYRDALLAGKFLSGLATLSVVFTAMWLLVAGLGVIWLGVPPSGEEVARGLMFLLATIVYGGVWLGLAMLFSVVFRSPATAALAAIAVWLFFFAFYGIVADVLTPILSPVRFGEEAELIRQAEVGLALARISPNTLYGEIVLAMLNPAVRALGFVLPSQLQGAILGTPLPLSQSLALIWPHLTGLIATVILLFAASYVLFQRQEVRA